MHAASNLLGLLTYALIAPHQHGSCGCQRQGRFRCPAALQIERSLSVCPPPTPPAPHTQLRKIATLVPGSDVQSVADQRACRPLKYQTRDSRVVRYCKLPSESSAASRPPPIVEMHTQLLEFIGLGCRTDRSVLKRQRTPRSPGLKPDGIRTKQILFDT